MPNVYVVQRTPGKDIRCAEEFGELKSVFSLTDMETLTDEELFHKAEEVLAKADVLDYLLPIGSPVAIAIASIALSERTQRTFRILEWDNREHRYYERVIIRSKRPGANLRREGV